MSSAPTHAVGSLVYIPSGSAKPEIIVDGKELLEGTIAEMDEAGARTRVQLKDGTHRWESNENILFPSV